MIYVVQKNSEFRYPDSLRTESVISSLYPFTERVEKSVCSLSVELPANKKPWMVLLKVNCLEGNELAVHPRHYAMRVVVAGRELVDSR